MFVLLASPHAHGVTDQLGEALCAGAGAKPFFLRDYQIAPCSGCGYCRRNNGICSLATDDAEFLFEKLMRASTAVFVSPIYFYALPGNFKCFIDRSQKFWQFPDATAEKAGKKTCALILAAARKRGRLLFSGSKLTVKWFLKPFGFALARTHELYGLENPGDITRELLDEMFDMGRNLAN